MARSQKGTSNTGYISQDMDGEISFLANLDLNDDEEAYDLKLQVSIKYIFTSWR